MPQWKQNSQEKSALMIDGARRIGKRFLRHSQIFEQLFVLINIKEAF